MKKKEPVVSEEQQAPAQPTVTRVAPNIQPIQFTPHNSQTYLVTKATGMRTPMEYASALRMANKYPKDYEIQQY